MTKGQLDTMSTKTNLHPALILTFLVASSSSLAFAQDATAPTVEASVVETPNSDAGEGRETSPATDTEAPEGAPEDASEGEEGQQSSTVPDMDSPLDEETRQTSRRGQLTLDQAQEIALARNPSIQMTALELARSEALIRQSWAAIYPIIGANLQYTMADEPTVVSFDTGASSLFGPAQEIVVRQQHVAALGISARQSIVNAQAIQGLRMANAARDLSEISIEQSRRQLVLGVAQAFYATISARHTLELIERHLSLAQRDVAAAQARLAAQVGLAHDVARAELEVERNRLQRESTLLGYHNARDSLALLMGIAPDDLPALDEPVVPEASTDDDIADFVERALSQRLDLAASRQQTRIAELDLNSIWMSFAPTLDLNWGLNYTLTELGGFGDRRTTWNLVIMANFPLFNGGLRYGQLRERRARLRQAQLAEEALEQSIAIDIRQAYRQWRSSLATQEISSRQLALARDAHRLVRESFRAGAATSLDIVSAVRALIGAEVDVELQRLSSQLALITLLSRIEVGGQSGAAVAPSAASGAP